MLIPHPFGKSIMRQANIRLDLNRQLHSVPVRNAHVRSISADGVGELRVEVTLRYSGWRTGLARWLQPAATRSYLLEGLGREVYESIDGQSTFEQIIDAFAARHQFSFLEARGLISQYFGTLIARGLVAVVVPDGESPS